MKVDVAALFNQKMTKLAEGGYLPEFIKKLEEVRQDSLVELIDSEEGSPKEREAKAMVKAINKIYDIPGELMFVEEPEQE
jgi:hypothetical protein